MAYSVCIGRLSTHYYCTGLLFSIVADIATYWSRSRPMVRCTFTCNSTHMMSLLLVHDWISLVCAVQHTVRIFKNVCKHDVITGVTNVIPPILLQRCKFYCSCNRLCCMLHVACFMFCCSCNSRFKRRWFACDTRRYIRVVWQTDFIDSFNSKISVRMANQLIAQRVSFSRFHQLISRPKQSHGL